MHELIRSFLRIPAPVAVGVVFLFTSCESALLLGLFVPGEVAAILGGVFAGRGAAGYTAVAGAAIAGAWTGDSLGYFLGRRLGGSRLVRRRRRRWDQARGWLKKRGGIAILFGRFTPFLRTIMPAAAGAARMPYTRFLAWDLATGAAWGAVSTGIGYVGARDFESVLRWTGRLGLALLAFVVLAGYFLLHRLSSGGRERR